MIRNYFKSLRTVWMMTALLLLSACNGKVDQDLIDSITGKISVVQVIIDQEDFTMKVGESTQLTAKVLPEDATDKTVTWSSSNEDVVMISSSGKAKAEGPGEATITAKAGGKSDFITITVEGGSDPVSTGTSVTVGSEKVSAVSVVLKGKANLGPTVPFNLYLGFEYKKNAEALVPSTPVPATSPDDDYNFSAILSGLEPGVIYSFRSVVTQDGQTFYGTPMTFTTKDLASMFGTLDASEIADYSVILNGKLDLTDVQCTTNEYGFYWGISEDSQTTYVKGGEIAENAYSAALTNLSPVTQYWYRAYLKLDDQTFYGDVKTVTTIWNPVTGVKLNRTQYTFNTIGNTLTLTPTVSPTDATNKAVSWKSSKTSVATVDANGKVTAVGNGAATVTVTTDDQGKTATCEITVAQWVTGITLDKTTLALNEGQTVTLSPTISPSNANDKSVTWSSSNTDVATVDQEGLVMAVGTGTATIKATAKDGSGVYGRCSVAVLQTSGAVDLGLSVKWSSCNLCESGFVTSPEIYGDYYTWGETQPYYAEGHSQDNPCSSWRSRTNPVITGYNWSSYKWCNGSYTTLTKYNTNSSYGGTVDNKTVLEANDDVAHVKLGGGWRMPTYAEWTELGNNCTWTWTTNYNGTGVAGRIVTSNKNGASIFLPAAGLRSGTGLFYVGSNGYYWSSSLNTDTPRDACIVRFGSGGVGRDYGYRYLGLSVRPVSE